MSVTTRENKCLSCGVLNDLATDINSDAVPKENDVSICFSCGHIAVFKEDLSLRELTEEEKDEVDNSEHIQETLSMMKLMKELMIKNQGGLH